MLFNLNRISEIKVIVTVRNGEEVLNRCLKSIADQTIVDFKCLVVNDCSEDETQSVINEFCTKDSRFSFLTNKNRMGPLYGRVIGVEKICKKDSFVVFIDGDDCLCDVDAFYYLFESYQQGALVVYGKSKVFHTGAILGQDYSHEVKKQRSYRIEKWLCSPPRCCFSGLLKHINNQSYFLHEGKWIDAATDMALFISLMELASSNVKFVDRIMYDYYWEPKKCTNYDKQKYYEKIIRKAPKLNRLISYV